MKSRLTLSSHDSAFLSHPGTGPRSRPHPWSPSRSAAERWQVNLATVVDIAGRYKEHLCAIAESRPTPELYDQAFAELALGDYTASRFVSSPQEAFQIHEIIPRHFG
jgi:hypothetical protein